MLTKAASFILNMGCFFYLRIFSNQKPIVITFEKTFLNVNQPEDEAAAAGI